MATVSAWSVVWFVCCESACCAPATKARAFNWYVSTRPCNGKALPDDGGLLHSVEAFEAFKVAGKAPDVLRVLARAAKGWVKAEVCAVNEERLVHPVLLQ